MVSERAGHADAATRPHTSVAQRLHHGQTSVQRNECDELELRDARCNYAVQCYTIVGLDYQKNPSQLTVLKYCNFISSYLK